MSNSEILPRNKQLKFHAAHNADKISQSLNEFYATYGGFADIDTELANPALFDDYSERLASAIPHKDPRQAHYAAYQAIHFALGITRTLYSEEEHPPVEEISDDIKGLTHDELQDLIEKSTQDYLLGKGHLEGLIESHIKQIDPLKNHIYTGVTVAAFVLKRVEDIYREDHRATINGQFEEIARCNKLPRRISENDVG